MRPHLPPQPPASPHGVKQREVSVAVAILCRRLSTIPRPQSRSPLSRAAGEGPGVRAALTFPLFCHNAEAFQYRLGWDRTMLRSSLHFAIPIVGTNGSARCFYLPILA